MSISPTTQDRIFEQFRAELEKNAKASSTEITNAKVEEPELKPKAKRAPAKTQAPNAEETTENVTDADANDEVVPEKCQLANKSDNKPCKNACKFSFVRDGVTVYACGMHCKNVATRVELAKAPAAKTTATTAKAPATKKTTSDVDKRKPSAYNEFMKTHLATYKAENPLVMHKDAFMKVASMWATAPENPNRK